MTMTYQGIWQHKEIRSHSNNIQTDFRISLDEGDTPINKFRDDNNNLLIIKREDLNPTGSWKDRASAYKISQLLSESQHEAVIASSGNAAISLLTYANDIQDLGFNIKLHIVVSPNISAVKKEKLLQLAFATDHEIHFEKNAKKMSVEISQEKNIPLLKSSIDNTILIAYWSLGFEIFKEIKHDINKNNILISPASSGTGLIGLSQGLFHALNDESKMPKIIAVQTQECHPLTEIRKTPSSSEEGDKSSVHEPNEVKSLADAIVDKSMLRKPQIEKLLLQTNGEAFVISNKELLFAKDYAFDHFDLELSYTSLLSIAGYLKLKNKYKNANFILITSGT